MTLDDLAKLAAAASQLTTALQAAATLAGVKLTDRQAAAASLAQTTIDVFHDSIVQQRDIDDVSWDQLNAEEALILAADQRAQAAAIARGRG